MSPSLSLSRRISGNALIKLASELAGRVATFALALLAARRLSEGDFGFYNYGLAVGFVIAQLADMGLQVLIAREVAARGRSAQPLVRQAFLVKVFLSVPVILLLLVVGNGRTPQVQAAILLLGLAMLLQTFLEFAVYVFRGQQNLQEEARMMVFARLLVAAIGGAVLILGGGLVGLGLSTLVAQLVAVTWAYWRLWHLGWLNRHHDDGARPWMWTRLFREAVPLGIAIILSITYTRLSVFLLEFRLGAGAVAQYSAAHRLVEPAQIVPAALIAAVFPAYTAALQTNRQQANRLGWITALLLGIGGVVLAAVFWLLAPFLIPFLYGDGFQESIQVLRYLGVSALFAYVNFALTHYLIARGQQLLSSIFVGVMLIVHFLLSWLLIPSLREAGPALSIIVAEFLLFVCCLVALRAAPPKTLTVKKN
ncbi:MAG: oligosaccharide flippase family protein [Candidatus Promineifilaceae bacterium]